MAQLNRDGFTTVKLLTAGDEQPPALQATAVTLYGPTGAVTEHEKVPDALAVVVHSVVLPGPVSVTVLFGVAVPETVGLVVAVPLLAGLVMPTVGGLTAVTFTTCLVQPAVLQAVTVTGVTPGFTVTLHEKLPDALAVAVHKVALLGSVMVTVLPGVAVPEMGWTVGPGWGWATVRLAGPTAVKLVTAGVEQLPPVQATAVMLLGPGFTVTVQE